MKMPKNNQEEQKPVEDLPVCDWYAVGATTLTYHRRASEEEVRAFISKPGLFRAMKLREVLTGRWI